MIVAEILQDSLRRLKYIVDEFQGLRWLKEEATEGIWVRERVRMVLRIHEDIVRAHIAMQNLAFESNGPMNCSES